MKVDLHVHSKFSTRPSIWLLQKIGCPESFSEPRAIYDLAKSRGMDAVTITDHNSIDGALEIADLPDVFVSEEITTYFPENRCKIHVLAYDIDEKIHAGIQSVRENIYDLVAYLGAEKIHHAVAHPLSAVNDRLTCENFERLLLLFKTFEQNGDQDWRVLECLRRILTVLKPSDIERLTERYGIEPQFPEPWVKNVIAGSDDHCSLTVARTYTEVGDAETPRDFLDAVADGRSRAVVKPSSPQTVARNLYAIAYQFLKKKFKIERYSKSDLLLKFLDRSLEPLHGRTENGLLSRLVFTWSRHRAGGGADDSLAGLLRQEAARLIKGDPGLMSIVEHGCDDEAAWFDFVNRVSNKALVHCAAGVMDRVLNAQFFDIFHSVGSAGALYSILTPYFVAFPMYTAERELSKKMLGRFPSAPGKYPSTGADARVAHFTDTYSQVNGVARTLQQMVGASVRAKKAMTVIACDGNGGEDERNVRHFSPIGEYALPEYPEHKLSFPPFLEIMNYCYEHDFTHLHSATPGPLGLTALALARILRRPIYGTYHTAFPQYARILTDDAGMEDLMWCYVVWYYNQMDLVFVNSLSSARELTAHGMAADKIRAFPRGVDTGLFAPDAKSDLLTKKFGVPENAIKLLYVGRVSREKNMPQLIEIFRALDVAIPALHLTVVGDGPYLDEMKDIARDLPVTFTGFLEPSAVAQIYPACDLFLFPSTTDTFGNVVLEAQASGLPAVVTDAGGPREIVVHGETGLVVEGNNTGDFVAAVTHVLARPEKLQAMRKAARAHAGRRSFDRAFAEFWAAAYTRSNAKDETAPAEKTRAFAPGAFTGKTFQELAAMTMSAIR